jgi:uncharacterized protein (DUF1800 family)
MPNDCMLSTGLSVYRPSAEMPWNAERVKHLYRRLGFGIDQKGREQALLREPEELVLEWIDKAAEAPLTPKPAWGDWALSNYTDFQSELASQVLEYGLTFARDLFENPLRARLNLFWQNHFVTRLEQYACPSWMHQYHRLLELHQWGHFPTFLKEMGKTPAMLVFLNGVQNTRFEPNENYARELFELFTLGRDQGYTQQDIVNAARALTGWNGFTQLCAPITFVPILHDPGVKTLFGRSGNFNYDTLHDLIFEERGQAVARFLCGKLYAHFVSPVPDPDFVEELATYWRGQNYELLPLYRKLFTCERFFDQGVLGVQVKSPIEYFTMFTTEMGWVLDDSMRTALLFQASELGQTLFNPPTVAGWPTDRQWITSSFLSQRWVAMELLAFREFVTDPKWLQDKLKEIVGMSSDAEAVTAGFVDFFLARGLNNALDYDALTTYFKWEVPENYFEEGVWNTEWDTVPTQTIVLLQKIIRLPEFQLC